MKDAMTENGAEETAPGSEPEADGESVDWGAGYRRLEGELTAFRAEFESLTEVATSEGETPDWVTRGRALLDRAERALENQKIEQGWHYLHAAGRLKFYGLDEDDLEKAARETLVEADNASLSWRADAIRERLAHADGSLREITVHNLRAARELLHEGYQREHRKREHLQAQFQYLKWGAVASILLFLLMSLLSVVEGIPSPFSPLTDMSSSSAEPVGFLVYVALAGMLGASLFGLRSLRTQPSSSSTPQHLTSRQATVARIVVGAGSALAVFFFLQSELLTINITGDPDQGPFLIAIAFVAGYSQRFVHTTIESVASAAETDDGDGGES